MSYSETTIVLYSINHIDKDCNTIDCLLGHYYDETRSIHEKAAHAFILELDGYIRDILALLCFFSLPYFRRIECCCVSETYICQFQESSF